MGEAIIFADHFRKLGSRLICKGPDFATPSTESSGCSGGCGCVAAGVVEQFAGGPAARWKA